MWHQHQDIKQWRYLRHLTAVTVATIAKNWYGVADCFKFDCLDLKQNNNGDFHCGNRLQDLAKSLNLRSLCSSRNSKNFAIICSTLTRLLSL
mmetsp:Transcript_2160/g.3454  ORF Transcript_2160/g.3454 Transcript_2160/m.3454 type:complete len:92 (+) Transcript_2160:250-525(+)